MKVKNSFPVYNTPEERDIIIQQTYTRLQKELKIKEKHGKKGKTDDRNICKTID